MSAGHPCIWGLSSVTFPQTSRRLVSLVPKGPLLGLYLEILDFYAILDMLKVQTPAKVIVNWISSWDPWIESLHSPSAGCFMVSQRAPLQLPGLRALCNCKTYRTWGATDKILESWCFPFSFLQNHLDLGAELNLAAQDKEEIPRFAKKLYSRQVLLAVADVS